MIPTKLLEKYNMRLLSDYKKSFGDSEDTEVTFYRTFLIQTDHIPLKLIEGALAAADCAEELKYREIARQEIARISGQPYESKENQRTLDERTEAAESTIDYLAMMTDIEIPTEV